MNTTAEKPDTTASAASDDTSTTGNPGTGGYPGTAGNHQADGGSSAYQDPPGNPEPAAGGPHASLRPRPDPLSRPASNRMLAGVAAGIARHLGVDVTAVRIVFAVLTVIGGAGVPIYLAGWLLIPDEGSSQSVADGLIQSWHDRRR